MYFIGVSTDGSSIHELFPRWTELLGLDTAHLVGMDLPLRAPDKDYRTAVEHIKSNEFARGALVTSHKVDLLAAARPLFDGLDRYAELCAETSCLTKRNGDLWALAMDPLTTAAALREIIPEGHWRNHEAHALCFGAGGAGTALTTAFTSEFERERRPSSLTVVDRDSDRLSALRNVLDEIDPSGIEVKLAETHTADENDHLMTRLPAGSLVVNATGMGKDIPGSPISEQVQFPSNGVVWELNYRGQLDFLRHANAQASDRQLKVRDGWRLFLINWSRIIAEIFNVSLTQSKFDQLVQAAEPFRPKR